MNNKPNAQAIIDRLEEGLSVTFHSNEPNPAYPNKARQSLNGRKCTVFEIVTNPDAGYPHDVAVGLQFDDEQRKTHATIFEFQFD